VYQRDDYTCQNCGVKGGRKGNAELHAHHIVPKSRGGTHKKSNLKTICKECHNAIHGDSMARPVDENQSTGQTDLPIEIDTFPYAVSEYVECLNTIAEIEERFTDFAEISGELVEYAGACQELDDDVPERVERRYRDQRDKALSILNDFQDKIESLRGIDTSEFDSSTTEELSSFIGVVDDLLSDMQEYVDLVHDMANTNSFSESDYYDLQFLNDEISDTKLAESISSFNESLNSEIYETLVKIDGIVHWSDIGADPIEVCPLCENDTEHETYSNDKIDVEFEYTRCGNCRAEWVNEGRTTRMINNTDNIESLSLDPAVWTRIRKDSDELSNKVGHYEKLSESLVNNKKKLLYGSVPIYIIFLLWTASSQLIGLLFVGLIVFLSVLVGGTNLLNYRMKS
jgi:Zn-finger nucleic acid-binding protein